MCINQYNTIFSLMQIVNISDENNGKDFIQGCNIINWKVVTLGFPIEQKL